MPARSSSSTCCSVCCGTSMGEETVTYVRNITDVDDKINARAFERGISIRELTEETARQLPRGHPRPRRADAGGRQRAGPAAGLHRAARHRAHRRDADDHRAADRARRRLCGRGARAVQRRAMARLTRAALRRLLEALARRDAGRRPRRRRALQARPDGFRALEAVRAAGPGLAVARRHRDAGPSGLAHRVLGHGVEASRRRPSSRGWPATTREARETFDIHGGGIDLVFPHHENEIAQTCCAFGIAAHGQCLDA